LPQFSRTFDPDLPPALLLFAPSGSPPGGQVWFAHVPRFSFNGDDQMKRILTATALVALVALTAPSFAATATAAKPAMKPATKTAMMKPAMAPAKPMVLSFKTIDANHDGKISYAEMKKYWPKLSKADFAKYDADKDGFYNHAELAAFAKAMAPAAPSK
jgi:hypothetical protein